MDDIERAQRRQQADTAAAIEAQQARAAGSRVEPVTIDGIACCADCEDPLPPHRVQAGLCVPCKELREQRERSTRGA